MALRRQTLNRGNIVTPICQYWPLAAEVGFSRGGEMPIVVVVASEGQGGDPPNDYCCLPHVWTPRREKNQSQLLELLIPAAAPTSVLYCSVSICYGLSLRNAHT